MAHNTPAGESIRYLRVLTSMTLAEVAERVPTSTSYLSKVETGKASPSRFWIGRVTTVLAAALTEERKTTAA